MRKFALSGLVLSGCLYLATPAVSLGQSPGQTGGAQSSPQSPSSPNSPTSNPDMNAPGQQGTSGAAAAPSKMDDKKFVKNTAMDGMLEVELGKLATQKGESDSVKKFGQQMVDDHGKANDQLKEAAQKSNIDVPSALDSKHQSKLNKMSKLSGAAFDKAYIKDQTKDHEKDISDFQAEAQSGSDPNIKQFATTTLPKLQEHKSMLDDMNKGGK